MRQIVCLLLLCCGLAISNIAHADEVTVNGKDVTIATARYRVIFDGLTLSFIENRLTGEVYTPPRAADDIMSAAMLALQPVQGIAVESLRPVVPIKYYRPCEQTKVTAQRTPTGATVSYAGLQTGSGADAEFAPEMLLTLTLAVEPATGDLLITPAVKGNIEEVYGVRDRGVLRSAVQVANLDGGLRVILPVADGVSFTGETAPAEWTEKAPRVFAWPQEWQAGLFIAESAKGCFGIWADEPKLTYARRLNLCRGLGQWQAAFEYETTDMNYRCDDITGATWRFNVFAGYWKAAAERYRAQMLAQWPEMKPQAQSGAAWTDAVRVVTGEALPTAEQTAKLLAAVPPETLLAYTREGWSSPPGKTSPTEFQSWPDYPADYTAVKGLPERAHALAAQGIHSISYLNCTVIPTSHPWGRRWGSFHFLTPFSVWQRFFPETCRDWVAKNGVDGICEGQSWLMGRHVGDEPAGANWYNATVRMQNYARQLLPTAAFMSEKNTEVTARGRQFALTAMRLPGDAHPINSYLFEPFLRLYPAQLPSEHLDAADIRGCLTPWPVAWDEHPLPEASLLRARGLLFAKEGLTSLWPAKWDPRVLHYYQGKDGTEYRVVRDHGARTVKVNGGKEESLAWRISGEREVEAPGLNIDGWMAYDGNRVIGLNPQAVYLPDPAVKRPPAVIRALSKEYCITRRVNGDGFWLAYLDTPTRDARSLPAPDAPLEKVEPILATVRVRAETPDVTFTGAESVKKLDGNEYELTVKLPGGILAVWGNPEKLKPLAVLATRETRNQITHLPTGALTGFGEVKIAGDAITQTVGDPDQREEAAMSWLITLPPLGSYLVFQYGTGVFAMDGADYQVRVNGKPIWKRYRAEISDKTPTAPAPIRYGAVDMSDYAEKTILLELVVDGHYANHNGGAKWGRPCFKDAPPKDADIDKPAGERGNDDPEEHPVVP